MDRAPELQSSKDREWVASTSNPVVLQQIAPAWYGQVQDRLKALLCLPDNWDSYGARKVSDANAQAAWRLIEILTWRGLRVPTLRATTGGGIQLELAHDSKEIEIEIVSPTKFLVLLEDMVTHEVTEMELGSDLGPLSTELGLAA